MCRKELFHLAYNDNYSKIKRDFENKKRNAIAEAEARTAEIHIKYPDLMAIDTELRATGINIMREAMKGKEGLEERIKKLKEKKRLCD